METLDSRAQAGLEYLMTYGWALILVAAIVGALVFLANPSTFQPTFSSSNPAKIFLKGASVSGSSAEMMLKNATSGRIEVGSVSFFGDLWPSADFNLNGQSSFPVKVVSGGDLFFEGLRTTPDCGAGGTIAVNYADASGLEQEVKINCNGGVPLPVAYYKFDEGSGETAVDSAGVNDGSLLPSGLGPTWQETGCTNAKCLSFDRVDDYVEITNIPVDTSPGARNTVEFLMYWDGTSGKMPFGWQQGYDLWLSGGCFGFNTGQGNVFGVPYTGLANKWVHVRAIFYNGVPSSENNALYLDGVKQSLYACSGITSSSRSVTQKAHISGWAVGSGYYFGGKIDEFKIYNQAIE